jgi:polyisoprenoid-binding protein YceI
MIKAFCGVYVALFFAIFVAQPNTPTIDPAKTTYLIQDKSVIEIQSLDFSGKFTSVKGQVSVDPRTNTISGFDLIIDVNSLDLEIGIYKLKYIKQLFHVFEKSYPKALNFTNI